VLITGANQRGQRQLKALPRKGCVRHFIYVSAPTTGSISYSHAQASETTGETFYHRQQAGATPMTLISAFENKGSQDGLKSMGSSIWPSQQLYSAVI